MANRKKSPSKRPKEKTPRASKPKAAKTSAPTGKPDTKVEKFKSKLRCKLSPEELAEKSDRLAHVVLEKDNLVAEAKSATAHLKARIKEKEAEIGGLSAQLRDKAEYKDVDCERRFIYRTGKIVEVRLDTEEQTYERAMTLSERQLSHPKLTEEPAKPVAPESAEARADESADDPEDDEDDDDDAPASDDEPSVGDAKEAEQTGDVTAE